MKKMHWVYFCATS